MSEEKDEAIAALTSVLDRIQEHYREEKSDGLAPLAGRPASWGFVHWSTKDVLEQLQLARAQFTGLRSPTLLECGAGFGFVATLARELGFAVTGLEIDPRYLEGAAKLFPLTRVVEQDLLTYEDWGAWDVIYYYAPFHDEHAAVAETFEHAVEDGIRPGGIIIANHKFSARWRDDPRFEELRSEAEVAYVIRKKAGA
jgi:2-polyprenyl-3-methyl-5-hydroxy-6-metoxy-1,4-benzoquinol methylase